ncbi:hypothetical protein BKA66DRAFT_413880 [Pyrenochaeta sp. MPI-SDFR-AT-0127]|nr:hypothetical protein BKA66DRAFT_413880 [Pyrenochaeta sp. MPI-SDFR-AT-0127]
MSTAQSTASPRASRGKHQPSQSATQPPQANAGRQSHRKPRGNRAQNGHHQHNGAAASPSRPPRGADPAFSESAVFSSEEAQLPTASRNPKKHTQSQPSIDRVFSPSGAQTALTDTEAAPNNPSATPAKLQGAYAGPTFHASPAPSALPIPKFLSRSVPAKTRAGPPTPPPEDSSDSAGSPSPTIASPSRAPIAVPSRNHDSPLDMLFKADKAERAKNVHGSPASSNFFNPPNPTRPQPYQHDSYGSANGVFPIELDGESRNDQMSPPPTAPPPTYRAVTDPCNVPPFQSASQPTNGNDVMQDLFSRLSMSQKNLGATTPPKADRHAPSDPQSRHQTPSPFHDGRSAVRSASGPSTPAPLNQESSDFFYGNKNLSPLFKAAKGDSSKRNSGLRTEITADSPVVAQGVFQDFPSVPPSRTMDPNTYSRGYPGRRHGHHARPDSYPARVNMNGQGSRSCKASSNGPAASAPKPSTTMMSFVPASVAAKQHSSSTPPSSGTPPPMVSPPSDTLALEQDLKRLLNLKMTGDATGVR